MRKDFTEFIKNELKPYSLLIGCGLPASGKTACASAVQKIKGYKILSTDIIRLEVLRNEDVFDEKVASDNDKRSLVYEELFKKADEIAGKVNGIILDATFFTQLLRRKAAFIADRHGMTLIIIQTHCPDEVCLRRISRRGKERYESNAITEQAFYNNLNNFEPVDINDIKKNYPDLSIVHVMVDTASDDIRDWFIVDITAK